MGDSAAEDITAPDTPSRAAKRKIQDEEQTQAKRVRESVEKRRKEREEQQRLKEEKKREEEQKKAEEKRIREEKKAEEKRLRDEKKREEEERKAEEKRLREEEKRLKEEKKREEEQKKAEEKRLREEKKREEEERKVEEKRQKEAEKLLKKKEEEEKKEAKRLEEERKREERRRQEEAQEAKKRKQSDRFLSFFEKKDPPLVKETVQVDSPWKPFELKKGWTMAPILRREPLTEEERSQLLTITVKELDYFKNLHRVCGPRRDPMRPKLLQFHDNIRPPYYGTWRKKPKKITGKRYLAREEVFDYDVDSDEEWEDDEEGEDCASDDDDPDSDEEKDEDDEKFLVAHGYLSEGEGDEEEIPAGESKEQRDARQRRKNEEWREEHEAKTVRNKTKVLVAKLYGPIFSFDEIPDEGRAMKVNGVVLNHVAPSLEASAK
uniref:Chromatin assembly factor 1 subunit A n=1 Tax=Steinernema glaseri TaxID=37863 RepID=A0A1I8A722_9BILA